MANQIEPGRQGGLLPGRNQEMEGDFFQKSSSRRPVGLGVAERYSSQYAMVLQCLRDVPDHVPLLGAAPSPTCAPPEAHGSVLTAHRQYQQLAVGPAHRGRKGDLTQDPADRTAAFLEGSWTECNGFAMFFTSVVTLWTPKPLLEHLRRPATDLSAPARAVER